MAERLEKKEARLATVYSGVMLPMTIPHQSPRRQSGVWLFLMLIGLGQTLCGDSAPRPDVIVSSLKELVEVADGRNQVIRMKPGTYRLSELATKRWIRQQRKEGRSRFMELKGSGNRYLMQDVVIEWETELRSEMRAPTHTGELVVTGDRNVFSGLTIKCTGHGVSRGGQLVELRGRGNVLEDCYFEIKGSSPYGYGDVFGKGGEAVIGHYKHSAIRVAGDDSRLLNCKVLMRSFGHGIFLQDDAANVLIENCQVVGEMRKTEEMLAERKGRPFERDFQMVFRTREGSNRLLPGYMKSLCEDGFRTYGQHPGLVLRGCRAKNVRGGFEIRSEAGAIIENCSAIGCERGFWVSSGARLRNCRADAQYGPALFLEGEEASVELEILPQVSDRKVHGLAMIHGQGHEVILKAGLGGERRRAVPIWIGYSAPARGDGMASFGEKRARRLDIRNRTRMPVRVGERVDGLSLETLGPVEENKGRGVQLNK
ncbi:MAG: right-handed parallel beta-helix repeat-containing protein [Verrucomicrobiota bacterium JB023]|nr:right-handed parallel beta-helix repeat-containing protein [Verrucomicrobiota bacterium JB023]